MSTPLPWVKAWTKVMLSPKWLDTPIEQRGVFDHLVRLGGVGSRRGFIEGSEDQLARQINVPREVVFSTLETFTKAPWNSLRRRKGGIAIINWAQYQTPQNFDPDYQRGRRQDVDTSIDTSIARAEGEGEGDREEEKTTHPLLARYPEWLAQPGDSAELDRLAKKYPVLDLEEELADFMAYAKRRSLTKDAYVDYIAAFRYQLKRHAATAPQMLSVGPKRGIG